LIRRLSEYFKKLKKFLLKGILSPVLLGGISVSNFWTQCGVSIDALYTAGSLLFEEAYLEQQLLKGSSRWGLNRRALESRKNNNIN